MRHITGIQAIGIILINTYESGKSRLNGSFSGIPSQGKSWSF